MKLTAGSICGLIVFVSLAGVLVTPAFAGECARPAGAWPRPFGPVSVVATAGGYSTFGIDHVLVIADVSDPADPAIVGMIDLPLPATDIVVSRDHAFVGTRGEGLRIIDLRDPETPIEIATYMPERRQVMGLSVAGDHLWVAAEHDGLRVLDISQPSEPVVVASRDIGQVGTGRDIDVVPPLAYMATAVGVVILNANTPESPDRVGYIQVPAHSVAAGSGYAYAMGGFGTLSAIDVSWPASPFLVTQIVLDGRDGRLTTSGQSLYVACGSDLTVLPADAPEAWWALSPGVYESGTDALDVAVTNGHAYLAAGSGGLQVLDVSDATEPTEIGRVETVGTVLDAVSDGRLTYVVDCPYSTSNFFQPQAPCRLRILDVSPGAVDSQIGSVGLADVPIEMAVTGDTVVVLTGGGLRIIDVTDPFHPVVVTAGYGSYGPSSSLAVADGFAYVTVISNYPGLEVVDVRIPSSPEPLVWINGQFTDIAVWGGLAALSGTGSRPGLWIYDVSDPASPSEIGLTETPGHTLHVAAFENHVFLTAGDIGGHNHYDNEVWIYDVGDPDSPILTGTFVATEFDDEEFIDLEASGGHIYLATIVSEAVLKSVIRSYSGLRTVDVSDPTAPRDLGFSETHGSAQRVSVTPNGDVIAADGWVGFEVFDVRECPGFIPSPTTSRQSGRRVVP
jgi:hypothetical protein